MNRPDRSQAKSRTVYLGSPFLSFPVYEDGALELTATNQKIPGKIAFNLVTSQVFCQFTGDSLVHEVHPDAFVVGGRRFVRTGNNKGEQGYYQVLYAGKSRVLAQLKNTLRLTKREPYSLDVSYEGSYSRQERYFIELDGKAPRLITLSKKSVRKALGPAANRILPTTRSRQLTVPELIESIARYDGFL
ncbi:hypothetical protein GCM10027347_21840 [Larkinella harenae]